MVPCVGLTNESWPRDSVYRIVDCIRSSPNIYHGGQPRHVFCEKLFGTTSEKNLNQNQQSHLERTLQSSATWMIKRNEGVEAIHSTSCLREVPEQKGVDLPVCKECNDVRQDNSLCAAISTKYAQGDDIKFTQKAFMEADGFQSTRRRFFEVDDVTMTLEKASKAEYDQLFWSKFATHARNGAFDNMDAFKGLVKAVSIRMERESNGKGLTGTCIEPAFDDFSTTLAAISPQGYRLFMETYTGRTTRSQRMIHSKLGLKLVDGLDSANFDHVFDHLQKLNYTGPLAVGTDETVCVKSLRVSNGMLVGAQGGSIPFQSTDDLKELVSSIIKEKRMCLKVSCIQLYFPVFSSSLTMSLNS